MTTPPSLKTLAMLALGPSDADVLSGEDWRKKQLLQAEERSTLVRGEPSILVSYIHYFVTCNCEAMKLYGRVEFLFNQEYCLE